MPFERIEVMATDGFHLAGGWQLTSGRPRAVVQLSHGIGEHLERYAGFAEAYAERGIAVFGHDHRGHGKSVDASTPLGHYGDHDGWAKVTTDLLVLRKHIEDRFPGIPVFLLGHSMGSIVARAFLLDHADRVAGAILSATSMRLGVGNRLLRWIAQREVRRLGLRTPSARMSKIVFGMFNLRFPPRRTGFEWLTRDTDIVAQYVADPLCGFACSGQLWADLFGGVSAVETRENDPSGLSTSLPLLLIAGSHDPVSFGGLGLRQLAARYRRAGSVVVDLHPPYPGGRHEMLNEINRAEVWADILTWIDQRLEAGRTGTR